MIRGYTRPQLLIKQILGTLPTTPARSLNAFVAGPRYDLFRYTNATERSGMNGVLFEENHSNDPSVQQVVPYEKLVPELQVVDEAFSALYGENLEGQYWVAPSAVSNTDGNPYQFRLVSLDAANKVQVSRRGAVISTTSDGDKITAATVVYGGTGYVPLSTHDLLVPGVGAGAYVRLTADANGVIATVSVIAAGSGYVSGVVFSAPSAAVGANVGVKNLTVGDVSGDDFNGDGIIDYPLLPELHGRPIKPGDIAYITFDDVTTRRVVKALERATVPSHVGSDSLKADMEFAASPLNPVRADAASFLNPVAPFNWTIGHSGTWNGLLSGSMYNGQYGDRYIITVTKAGTVGNPPSDGNIGQVRIRTASGKFSADNVAVTKAAGIHTINDATGALGGLTITLTYTGDANFALQMGDQYAFEIYEPYNPLNLTAGGQVASVTISTGGNYSVPPLGVSFSAPPLGGVTAKGKIFMAGSAITGVQITDPGSGYVAPPIVTVVGGTAVVPAVLVVVMTTPANRDLELMPSSVYIGKTNTRYRVEVIAGTPLANQSHANDTFTGAVVRVSDTSGIDAIQEYTIVHGTQYPLGTLGLKFQFPSGLATPGGPGSGSPATATAHYGLDDNPLTEVTTFGTGYTPGQVVNVNGGTAITPAQITVDSIGAGGSIDSWHVSNPGEYSAIPAAGGHMTLASGGGAIAPSWHIVSVNVTAPGSGYASPPVVTINDAGFPPEVPAVLTPIVIDGAVEGIEVSDPGAGYAQGVTLTLSPPVVYQPGMRKGDVFFIDAVATSQSGSTSVIVFNGQATDVTSWIDSDVQNNLLDMEFREPFNGLVPVQGPNPPELQWVAGDAEVGGITVAHNLQVQDTAFDDGFQWLPVKNSDLGRLFASWRGLVPARITDVITLYSAEADIITDFGAFDPQNPVCYGAIMAFRGGQQKSVWVSAVPSDDAIGYSTILKQAERIDGIYALAPMTYDRQVQEAFQSHVDKTGLPNWKLWRRVYVATKNIGTYPVQTTDPDGNVIECVIQHTSSGNVRLICANGNFLTQGVLPGDVVRLNFVTDDWGNETYDSFVVEIVVENDELILVSGPDAPVSPAVRFEIWRPDTGASQAQYIGNRSNSFLDRRVVNVWCDSPMLPDADGNLHVTELYFLAAEIAGLRAAVLPQQGLTYTELNNSVTAAPLMFSKYSEEDLDVAAAMGTWIVTQDVSGGPVYIRHQLTTDAQDSLGPLYWEDSVGTNLDNIAYSVKDTFQPYIGRRNANPETLEEIETKLRDLLNGFKGNSPGFSNIGPAVADWSGLSVQIDPVFRDRINVIVTLQLPLPINVITVTLQATTIADETFITFQQEQANLTTAAV